MLLSEERMKVSKRIISVLFQILATDLFAFFKILGSLQDIELFQIFQFPNKFSESSNLTVPSPNMKSGRRRLRKLTRIATLPVARIKMRGKKSQSKQLDTILQGLRYFCTQTTLHGLRYVVDPDLHMMERFLWLVLFVGSSISASHVIYSLALRFQVKITYKREVVFTNPSKLFKNSEIQRFRRPSIILKQWTIYGDFY